MIWELVKKLTDPKTKEATAFYAALAAVVLDAYHRGFHLWNVVLIGSLCGITVSGLLAAILGRVKPEDKNEDSDKV